ncbi:MAG TPA: DUF177 domain-containing protein [Acidimicrobiia bacterium]|nr:DUF177 domain-containing protein [Acidimicrobiia bacterium]
MTHDLVVPVGDLIGSPGRDRPFAGEVTLSLDFGDSRVDGPMTLSGRVVGLIDAVEAEFTASASAHFTCTRCLTEWDGPVEAASKRYFRRLPDEDGYAIEEDEVDISGPARDELALALPATPLCRADCRGLCPTCGTDLNSEPCGGHGDDSDSPFATLKDLFDS